MISNVPKSESLIKITPKVGTVEHLDEQIGFRDLSDMLSLDNLQTSACHESSVM